MADPDKPTRADIEADLAAFRKAGGKVKRIPYGATGLDKRGLPPGRKPRDLGDLAKSRPRRGRRR